MKLPRAGHRVRFTRVHYLVTSYDYNTVIGRIRFDVGRPADDVAVTLCEADRRWKLRRLKTTTHHERVDCPVCLKLIPRLALYTLTE